MNIVEGVKWDQCTGCGMCSAICPTKAITMKENSQGFLHPFVDRRRCPDCGLCLSKCPVKNPVYRNKSNPECRAVWAVDRIREHASSGGVFAAFAEVMLQRGGVVCGAAYDAEWNVHHILIDSIERLNEITSSKYVQSDCSLAYKEIEKALREGKEVLFGGCPCQVAAVNNFLDKSLTNKLYTMDVVCHGVPSPAVFRKYLKENFREREIDSINFRDKSYYGWASEMNIHFKNGENFRERHDVNPYYRAFLPILSIRKSCSSCPFSRLPRQGDLTIGDFWGIDRYNKEMNDKKGTSLVLVNNEKGRRIMRSCHHLWTLNKTVPIDEGTRINKTILAPFHSHPARNRFFDNLDRLRLSELVDKCLAHKYDIGIVGLWYGINYGSILTYYALYQAVNQMGFDAIMVSKPKEFWDKKFADPHSVANKFIFSHCYVSNPRPFSEYWQMNDHCDTFIVGSDVVWNYDICGRDSHQYFFLDFVDDGKKKIAMASSFGAGYDAPDEEKTLSQYYMRKFDYIGVREKEAQDICRNTFGVQADLVMDPVFLCDKSNYYKLANEAGASEDGEFIASYILGADYRKEEILRHISKVLDMPMCNIPNPNIPEAFNKYMTLEALKEPSVEDWLYYMMHCSFFVGDSFHGLCFALIFNRPFLITVSSTISGLCRFTTLLELVGLEDRLIIVDRDRFEDKEYLIHEEIDYDKVNAILTERANVSYQWLYHAITEKKTADRSAVDILISRMQDTIRRLNEEVDRLKK